MVGWIGAAALAAVGGLKGQGSPWRQIQYMGALAATAYFIARSLRKSNDDDEAPRVEQKVADDDSRNEQEGPRPDSLESETVTHTGSVKPEEMVENVCVKTERSESENWEFLADTLNPQVEHEAGDASETVNTKQKISPAHSDHLEWVMEPDCHFNSAARADAFTSRNTTVPLSMVQSFELDSEKAEVNVEDYFFTEVGEVPLPFVTISAMNPVAQGAEPNADKFLESNSPPISVQCSDSNHVLNSSPSDPLEREDRFSDSSVDEDAEVNAAGEASDADVCNTYPSCSTAVEEELDHCQFPNLIRSCESVPPPLSSSSMLDEAREPFQEESSSSKRKAPGAGVARESNTVGRPSESLESGDGHRQLSDPVATSKSCSSDQGLPGSAPASFHSKERESCGGLGADGHLSSTETSHDEPKLQLPSHVKKIITAAKYPDSDAVDSPQEEYAERMQSYDDYLADPALSPTMRSQVLRAKVALKRLYDSDE